MEIDVLEGGRATIARFQPTLFVANQASERSGDLISIIESLDYDAYWHFGGVYREDNFFHTTVNIFGQAMQINLLCFPRSWQANIEGLPKVTGPEKHLAACRAAARSSSRINTPLVVGRTQRGGRTGPPVQWVMPGRHRFAHDPCRVEHMGSGMCWWSRAMRSLYRAGRDRICPSK